MKRVFDENSRMQLLVVRDMLLDEIVKLERLLSNVAERPVIELTLREWMIVLRKIAGELGVIEDYLRRGLTASAGIEACIVLKTIYAALARPRDPIYDNVKFLLASAAASLSPMCRDERQSASADERDDEALGQRPLQL